MLDSLGKDFDADLHAARDTIQKENCDIQHLKDVIKSAHSCSDECSGCEKAEEAVSTKTQQELKKKEADRHPGFSVAFDNIGMQVKAKNMTMANQNKDVHWINHRMLMNRVSGNSC